MHLTLAGTRRTKGHLIIASLVGSALLLTAACGGDAGAGPGTVNAPPKNTSGDLLAPIPLEKKTKVTFGISSKLEAFAPALLADHFGEFEKENLDLEFKFVPPTDSTLLVAQGKLDVVAGAFTAGTFNLVASGSPFKFAFPGVSQPEGSTQGYWVNKEEVNPDGAPLTADMFKGKKFLTPSGDGSPSAFQLYTYVKSLPGGEDFEPTDLEFEVFDPTMAADAVKSGAAAGAQINSPFDLQLKGDACCDFLDGAIPYERTVSTWFFGPSMKGHADVGAAIVRSLARTIHTYLPADYRTNDKTMDALSEILEIDRKILDKLPPLYWDPEFPTHAEINLREGQPFFRARGLLQYDDDIEVDDIYDMSYLEAIGAGQ